MTRALPSRWFAPRAPAPPSLHDDLAAIESGDASAMRRVLEGVGKLVGPGDVTAGAGGVGVEAFAESLRDPIDDLSEIDDAEAEALLTNVIEGAYSEADTQRALEALERAFDQPALTDLIYWPRADLGAKELVRVARSTRGAALVPWLSPECGEPAEHVATAPSSSSLRAARATLMSLVEAQALELLFGEAAAAGLAALIDSGADAHALAAAMFDLEGIGEIYADDETLREALSRGGGDPKRRA